METSLYHLTVPILIRGLERLSSFLRKGEEYSNDSQHPNEEMLNARLYPDMFTLTQQVQYAYFSAIEITEHLSGKAAPKLAYDETTFAQLESSLKAVLNYLHNISPKDIDGKESTPVPLYWDKTVTLPGLDYVQEVGLPNFFFHSVTAYGILRNLGVKLGKSDYIGEVSAG